MRKEKRKGQGKDIRDKELEKIKHCIRLHKRKERQNRKFLNGVFWMLRTVLPLRCLQSDSGIWYIKNF